MSHASSPDIGLLASIAFKFLHLQIFTLELFTSSPGGLPSKLPECLLPGNWVTVMPSAHHYLGFAISDLPGIIAIRLHQTIGQPPPLQYLLLSNAYQIRLITCFRHYHAFRHCLRDRTFSPLINVDGTLSAGSLPTLLRRRRTSRYPQFNNITGQSLPLTISRYRRQYRYLAFYASANAL